MWSSTTTSFKIDFWTAPPWTQDICNTHNAKHTLYQKKKIWRKATSFRMFRKIYEPVREGHEWRIRMNYKLMALYQHPNNIGLVKCKRLSWYGRLLCMSSERIVNQNFHKTPTIKRPPGMPRTQELGLTTFNKI